MRIYFRAFTWLQVRCHLKFTSVLFRRVLKAAIHDGRQSIGQNNNRYAPPLSIEPKITRL